MCIGVVGGGVVVVGCLCCVVVLYDMVVDCI